MSWIGEQVLYWLVKRLSKTEIAHSNEMRDALRDWDAFDVYRSEQIRRVGSAAQKYGVDFEDKTLLDLGCGDGAISVGYLMLGAQKVVGVDIEERSIERANQHFANERAEFHLGSVGGIPLPDESVDVVTCIDVLEHVAKPEMILAECKRVLRPGGKMLIWTWGWGHPFAPHLWHVMPVPWAHLLFSEKTVLRVCRRVAESNWYKPTVFDLDNDGNKRTDAYTRDAISTDYLNKYFLKDYDRLFSESGMTFVVHPLAFSSKYASWTQIFLKTPWLREFLTSYIWVVLEKAGGEKPIGERCANRGAVRRSDQNVEASLARVESAPE